MLVLVLLARVLKQSEDVFVKREQKNLEYSNYLYTYKYIVREVKEIQNDILRKMPLYIMKNLSLRR